VGIMSPKKDDQEPEPIPAVALSDETLKLHRHRYREGRRAGMGFTDAKLFASSQVDIEAMRALARKGCDPHLLLRILL